MTPPPSRITSATVFLAVLTVYAGLSGYLTSRSPEWYAGLDEPSFQPPDLVFGLIWPLNFLALGIVGVAYCFTQRRAYSSIFASSTSITGMSSWTG